ncbi:MAG TPA: hypothetical protein VMJ65_13275 [Solirubrobacteraceae bacterium]|nr:hypothetical protein [Solirubrobacteraceae bacterium]
MSTTSGNNNLPDGNARRSTKVMEFLNRLYDGLAGIRASLPAGRRRHGSDADRRDRRPSECASGGQLTAVVAAGREPITTDPRPRDGETGVNELVSLPEERSRALAALCERFLQELDGEEVGAAEIRFVVHKQERPGCPSLDPASVTGASGGELMWELRRLIAWSGGTIADVARALETRGADLDENARELLRDEIAALDVDLETLSVHLADPVDWDREFEWLLGGEVAPFDDFAGDQDDEHDD